jgi:hypothetical protein
LRSRRRAAPDYRFDPSGVGSPEHRNGDISITPAAASWDDARDCFLVGEAVAAGYSNATVTMVASSAWS